MDFKLNQNFKEDLKNVSSPAFKELASTVATALDTVYRNKYGSSFNHTEVLGFRKGSIEVNAVLIFNNDSSVPESSAVVATLIENVSSNSSNFSLPVNTTSIVATRVVSTSAPTTTSTPVPPISTPYTVMNATSAPSNRSTTTMVVNATSDHVTQSNTTATPSLSTSPVVNATAHPTTPVVSATVPPTTAVVNTSLSPTARLPTKPVATAPVPTIQVPTTMASPATEAPLTSPKLSLRFSLTSTFNSSLSNSSSTEFLALANHVTTQLDNLFKAQFGARFNRTVVNSFRSGSIVVESTLIFNNISSVPDNSLVAQTLQTAITSNTSGLTLPINSSSIVVTRATTMTNATTSAATTAAPTAAVTTTTLADVTTTPPAVAKTTTTAVPAAATTTVAPTGPPSSSEGTLILRFSLNQMFTLDLANPSSSAFKTLAGKVVLEVNRIFSVTPSFLRSIVNSFKNGSVVTNMTLVFKNKFSVPSACSAQATFTISNTSLNILPGSVNVESSVNSGSAPRPTAFCLAFLPLTLALLMVQLLAN
ncbi:uncharacterized protein ACWYII_041015 [Salvelinus alpinus]